MPSAYFPDLGLRTERVKGIEPSLSAWENQLDHRSWSGMLREVAVTCGFVAASAGYVRARTGWFGAVPQQDPQQCPVGGGAGSGLDSGG